MNAQGIIDQATYTDLKDVMGADFIEELIDTYSLETEGLIRQLREAL